MPWPVGSSPLTRGKRAVAADSTIGAGLIPTHAGKTFQPGGGESGLWAHPHSRGENAPRLMGGGRVCGSSPLTRGKPIAPLGVGDSGGLIPTHAGKTRERMGRRGNLGAHPHSRGENGCCGRGSRLDRGSSPLTRGKQHLRPHRGPCDGLIPTHAGKTLCRLSIHCR